jgi:hypothetical protein
MRIALLFSGLVSNPNGDANNGIHYAIPCYEHIVKHIIAPNVNKHTIDTYFYCWGKTSFITNLLCELYRPVTYRFTEEQLDNNFLSKMKGNHLVFSLAKDKEYDLYVFLRPDIIFNADINFDRYDIDKIYHNDGRPTEGGHFGDMYFIMNHKNAIAFTSLYEKLYPALSTESFTESNFRNKYLPILQSTLLLQGDVLNDLRCGSYQELEVFRKYRVHF